MAADDTSLQHKTCLISGATTGIGRAIAESLLRHGARVMFFAPDPDDVSRAQSELKTLGAAHGISADASNPADIARVFEHFDSLLGPLDILINNAALSAAFQADSIPYDRLDAAIRTNVLGYMNCTRLAIQRMRPRKQGHIVNIGSMSADLREPAGPVYTATKAAIQAYTESLRKDVNADSIRVTLIEPGAVDTTIWDRAGVPKPGTPQSLSMLTAADIADAVLYCLTRPLRTAVVSMQIRPLKQLI